MTDAAIEVRDLTFQYGSATQPSLRNLSLTVPKGRKLLLMGPSGAGKTTLFQCLTGICPKLLGGSIHGSIRILGEDIASKSIYDVCRSINVVFQNPDDQLCNITVEDEIAFGLENYAETPERMRELVERCLQVVGMHRLRNKYVFHLSGGQRQRLALGSVLALDPPILLLDEPTSNLDPEGTHELMNVIDRLTDSAGLTMMIVQRQADEIIKRVDEVAVMVDGTITMQGSPEQILGACGRTLRDVHHLWLPQVSEFWMELGARAPSLVTTPAPLSVEQAAATIGKHFAPEDTFALPPSRQDAEPPRPPAAATVRDVRFAYPDGTVALGGVSLDIPERAVTAILGQNGSGKTTLAMLLTGLHRSTDGEVRVLGYAPGSRQLRGQVSYVFQFPDLQFVKHSVLEEMAHGLATSGVTPAEARARAHAELERLGLAGRADRHPYSLSAGEKRLLSVAAMLMPPPRLLILDEPTYGLDWEAAHRVMELVLRCRDAGSAVVLITHDMRLVAEFADHAAVLVRGEKLFEGAPRALFAQSDVLERSALKPPPVHDLAMLTIGRGVLSVRELCDRLVKQAIGPKQEALAWPA